MTAETDTLAKAFADTLRQWLTPAQWEAMRLRNATPDYQHGACASHDYCDANMAMDAAFTATMGRDALPDNGEGMTDADCALWGLAWDRARQLYLQEGNAPC